METSSGGSKILRKGRGLRAGSVDNVDPPLTRVRARATATASTVSASATDDDDVLEEPDSPPSAFFLFMNKFEEDYEKKHPADVKQLYVIGMAGDKEWESMSDVAKEPYVLEAQELKEKYMSERDKYLGVADALKPNKKKKNNEQRRKPKGIWKPPVIHKDVAHPSRNLATAKSWSSA